MRRYRAKKTIQFVGYLNSLTFNKYLLSPWNKMKKSTQFCL